MAVKIAFRRVVKAAVTCGLVGLVWIAAGRIDAQTLDISRRVFALGLSEEQVVSEEWQDGVLFSAPGRFVGLRIAGAPVPETLVARVPAELAGQQVCFRLQGDPVQYRSIRSARVVADWDGGLSSVTYTTQHFNDPRDLRALPPEQMLVQALVGGCYERRDPVYLLAGWQSDARPGPAQIFLNLDQGLRVSLLGAATPEAACQPAPAGAVSWSYACPLELGGLAPGEHRFVVRQYERYPQRQRDSLGFSIWIVP